MLTDAFRDRYMELNLSKQKMLIVCGMLREKKKKKKEKCLNVPKHSDIILSFLILFLQKRQGFQFPSFFVR